ncbi:hypothetical protein ZWY2020_056029 [Hordeum vulgare]|nr:hypothetical protein ZWY2020_040979 [Hordeum vulgare]KAI5014639.1 hypothetical protein ZWY2020_056029 [Hordeum vulgare]
MLEAARRRPVSWAEAAASLLTRSVSSTGARASPATLAAREPAQPPATSSPRWPRARPRRVNTDRTRPGNAKVASQLPLHVVPATPRQIPRPSFATRPSLARPFPARLCHPNCMVTSHLFLAHA